VKNVSLRIFDPSLGIFDPARCRRNRDFLGGFPPEPRSVLRNRQGIPPTGSQFCRLPGRAGARGWSAPGIMAIRLAALAPVAMASGRLPKANAIEVIRIGRSRAQALATMTAEPRHLASRSASRTKSRDRCRCQSRPSPRLGHHLSRQRTCRRPQRPIRLAQFRPVRSRLADG